MLSSCPGLLRFIPLVDARVFRISPLRENFQVMNMLGLLMIDWMNFTSDPAGATTRVGDP